MNRMAKGDKHSKNAAKDFHSTWSVPRNTQQLLAYKYPVNINGKHSVSTR